MQHDAEQTGKRALDADADDDTELKIPMAVLDKNTFSAALDSLRPRGKTPLALSIDAALQDLGQPDPAKPDGTPRKLLDVGRLNALGWRPRIPLRDGVRETYRWFLAHQASLRL
jgi:hypothetical protein